MIEWVAPTRVHALEGLVLMYHRSLSNLFEGLGSQFPKSVSEKTIVNTPLPETQKFDGTSQYGKTKETTDLSVDCFYVEAFATHFPKFIIQD